MTETFLQNYGWVLVSLLGGLLVTLMFLMGANLLLGNSRLDMLRKWAVLKATGRKLGFAILALLAFGAALYFAFPLFFRTAFLNGYRVWMVLVATFAFQLTAYAVCCWTKGRLMRSEVFRIFLIINGILAPFFLGTTIGTFFTGAEFVVDRATAPEAVTWCGPWRGLEMFRQPQAVLLCLIHVCLSYLLGALYVIRVVDDHDVRKQMRRSARIMSIPFMVLSLTWLVLLLLRPGFSVDADGIVSMEAYKYLLAILHYRPVQAVFVVGAVLFVLGLYFGIFTKSRRKGFWFTAAGTVIVVMGIFFLAGFNGTAYFPSITDLQSSLTIRNSAAEVDTLQKMFWPSLSLPVILFGLGYVWHRVDHKKKITMHGLERKSK